jgi:LuxR family maltose regulon positive regulatory protein
LLICAEPAQLMRSLIEGLRALFPGVGAAELALLRQTTVDQPSSIELVLSGLMADLHQQSTPQQPVLVIIDDYHLVRGSANDHLCALLFEQLPAGFQVLLTCRGRPSWSLARMRVGNQLLEFDECDLRVARAPAQLFLEQAGVKVFDAQWLRQRIERNECWFAGLRMLALTARQPVTPSARSEEQLVEAYLLEEVIQT